jgi:putative membrane protein
MNKIINKLRNQKYNLFLLLSFATAWCWAAYNPKYYEGWLLENYLVFLFVPLLLISFWFFRLSKVSYTLITIFMILHVIGAHYTYSEVPFGYTLQDWFGSDRNMYDRVVHFGFGFFFVYALREIHMRVSGAKGFWSYFFPVMSALAYANIYELIEWYAARNVPPQEALSFLGSQGDIWDAQKDMALAGVGALLVMFIVFFINMYFDKNFWKDMKNSFRPKKLESNLGEIKIEKYLK